MRSGWPNDRTWRLCRRTIRLAAALVPWPRREEFVEAWEAELWAYWKRRRPAAAAARLGAIVFSLGAVPHAAWEFRDRWTTGSLVGDLRFAMRTMGRSPGFALVATATVALGIGANTTIFSLVNAVLFRTPPGIARPDRLALVGRGASAEGFDAYSYPTYRDLRARNGVFTDLAAYADVSLTLGTGGQTEILAGQLVTAGYFDLLGARLPLGRGFRAQEEQEPGAHPVAVISDRTWARRFERSPDVLSRTVLLNGRPFAIVGVAPPGFAGLDIVRRATDVWLPIGMVEAATGRPSPLDVRGNSWLWVFGRLAPGVTLAEARAAMSVLAADFRESVDGAGRGVVLVEGVGLRPGERREAEVISRLLLGVVTAVLLIACANLAGLLLARGAARRREIGVRRALGAGRGRLVRQLLTESMAIALAGGFAAGLLTIWTATLLPRVLPFALSVDLAPDLRVFAFGLALAIASGLAFGLAPAWMSAAGDLVPALRDGPESPRAGRSRLRTGLVVFELALSFVLLAAAGLLVRSLVNAGHADPGFRTRDVALFSMDLDRSGRYAGDDEVVRFQGAALERVRALAGVEAAAFAAAVPIADYQPNRSAWPADEPPEPGRIAPPVFDNAVSPGFFETLGLPIVLGRAFDAGLDRADTPPVAVVSETLAGRFWPGRDPLGETVVFGGGQARVVGVVADSRVVSLRSRPGPVLYLPLAQHRHGRVTLFARGAAASASAVVEAIRLLDPDLPVYGTARLDDRVQASLGETRTVAVLVGLFGLVALMLAVMGLYGVVAQSVAHRTREFGIRVALGATPRDVVGHVLGRGLRLSAIGLAVGLMLAVAGLRVIQGLLFGVGALDAPTLAAIAVFLLAVALGASYVPARRAVRRDPLAALRAE